MNKTRTNENLMNNSNQSQSEQTQIINEFKIYKMNTIKNNEKLNVKSIKKEVQEMLTHQHRLKLHHKLGVLKRKMNYLINQIDETYNYDVESTERVCNSLTDLMEEIKVNN